MKRVGVFSYFPQGKVLSGIKFLLNEMVELLDRIIIVSNGLISKCEQDYFNSLKLDKEVLELKKSSNNSIAAWKHGILKINTLKPYDEMILFDDSFWGPFCSMKKIFSEMQRRACNFWGLVMQFEMPDYLGAGANGYLPPHIATSFVTIRRRMLNDRKFVRYWKEIEEQRDKCRLDNLHELYFTKTFTNYGYQYDSYTDLSGLERKTEKNIPYIYQQEYLIKNRNCPVMYKDIFLFSTGDKLKYDDCGYVNSLIKYIGDKKKYNTEIIYEEIIQKYNSADLQHVLDLSYILPVERIKTTGVQGTDKKVAVMMHLFYEDIFEYCIQYAVNIPDYMDLYITTDTEKKRSKIMEIFLQYEKQPEKILLTGNRGRDVAALLVELRPYIMQYEYICFVHDKKSSHLIPETGAWYQEALWENMLKSRGYIENIIDLLEGDPHLGLLGAPEPYAGSWFGIKANTWTESYGVTQELYEKMGLSVPISKEKNAVALGTVFWCKTKALSQLFTYPWQYEDFPKEPMGLDATLGHAVERILAFVAQENGYYTGWVRNCTYAQRELVNINGMFDGLIQGAVRHMGMNYCDGFATFLDCLHQRLEIADKSQSSVTKACKKIGKKVLPAGTVKRIIRAKNILIRRKEYKNG